MLHVCEGEVVEQLLDVFHSRVDVVISGNLQLILEISTLLDSSVVDQHRARKKNVVRGACILSESSGELRYLGKVIFLHLTVIVLSANVLVMHFLHCTLYLSEDFACDFMRHPMDPIDFILPIFFGLFHLHWLNFVFLKFKQLCRGNRLLSYIGL